MHSYLHHLSVVSTPVLEIGTTGATYITLMWSSAGAEVDSYEVVWQRMSGECRADDMGNKTVLDSSTNFTIVDVEEYSSYSITVTASNAAGRNAVSNSVTATTLESGKLCRCESLIILITTLTAPSASPAFVNISKITSSSITVHWGTVDCIHRNGAITGYTVVYMSVDGKHNHTNNTSGDSVMEMTILGLKPSSRYSVTVAAVNTAGIGIYSNASTIETASMSKLY